MNTKNFNTIDVVIAKLRLRKVAQYVKDKETILDFGCGSRSFLLEYASNKIKLGVGIDYEVKNKKFKNIKYINYRFITGLPIKNVYFDKVFLLAVLEHIEINKVKRLFKEFARILKDDGEIILTTPTPFSKTFLEFLAFKINLISKEEVGDHKKYYSKNDIQKIADGVGLKIISYNLFQLGLNSISVLKKDIKKIIK